MHFVLRSAARAAVGLLAAAAIGQVTIPPHANTYNGSSRGYNFTANTPFYIVQLELPLDAFQTGDTASFLVLVNGAVALRSFGNASPMLPTAIQINPGDVVDVIGNWSPAAVGSFSAHNSYTTALTTPFATTIEGVPHTIVRCGWQWDVGDPAWVSTGTTGTYLPPTLGQIGRVIIYTSSGSGTIATNTTLGTGCLQQHASFYENFVTAASFDLNGAAFTMVPTPGGGYDVTTGGAFMPMGTVSPPVALALVDDSEVTVPLAAMGSFPAPAGAVTSLTVCSNGFVSTATGNGTSYAPVVSAMLAAPQTSWRTWHDFNPAAAGSGPVLFEESASVSTVTWNSVRNFGGTTAADDSTFQMQFFQNGTVAIAYQTMAATGSAYLVGYSPAGPSADPGPIDLSALGANVVPLGNVDVLPLALAPSTRPVLGTSWNLTVGNVPPSTVFGVHIFGASDPGILDLGFLGMPSCQLRANLDIVVGPWVPGGPMFAYGAPIPPTPASLVGFELFTQAATFGVPPVNAFGAITSNGIKGTIGDL